MALPRKDGPRRGIRIPAGGYALIERLAKAGGKESAIAQQLGFSASSWARLKAADEKAMLAFQRGRDALEQELIAAVRHPALPDDPELSISERIALMRSRQHGATVIGNSLFNWARPEVETAPVSVTITLPGAMTPDAYAKTIHATAIPAGTTDDD